MRRRPPLLFHPSVLMAIAALSGSFGAIRFWPSLFVACVWVIWGTRAAFPPDLGTGQRSLFLVLCGSLFALTHSRALASIDSYQERHAGLAAEMNEPARCAGVGQVTSSPIVRSSFEEKETATSSLSSNQKPSVEQMSSFQVFFSELDCGRGAPFQDVTVRITAPPSPASRGDRLEVIGQFAPVRLFRNAEVGDAWPMAARHGSHLSGRAYVVDLLVPGRGLPSTIDRLRAHVRRRIEATYSPVVAPLGRALVLGESDLGQEDAEAFRNSGLLHLLAVSGTHLVIFVLSTVRALHALLVRMTWFSRRGDVARWSAAWGALSSLLYADFSGGSGSAWRAAIMLCCMCGGRALGLRVGGAAALGASLLVGVLWAPLAASDASFLLSALATAGLIGLGQPITRAICRGHFARTPFRQLAESFTATVSSTVTCAPLLATMDDSMTWAAIFANVLAAPLGELVALPACLLHAVVSFAPPLESGLAFLGSGALFGVRQVALLSASIESAQFLVPYPSAPQVAMLCIAVVGVALLVRGEGRSSALAHIACISVLFWGLIPWTAQAGPRTVRPLAITALDVGQGDALLVDLPDGKHALVDGGGYVMGLPDIGRRVVLPVLRARGIDRLDWMVVSHAHPDHITGLIPVARALPVDQLWLPSSVRRGEGSFEPPPTCETPQRGTWGPVRELVGAVCARGGRIFTSSELCPTPQVWGEVRVEVLSPCIAADPAWSMNDASLVLRLVHGSTRALLTGDIEHAAEGWLVEHRGEELGAEFLKVAHHGSDTSSTPSFLDRVRPHTAFISSGVRNRFRHPRPSTLSALRQQGVQVYRTDQRGSLTWHSDGERHWVRTADPAPQFGSAPPGLASTSVASR